MSAVNLEKKLAYHPFGPDAGHRPQQRSSHTQELRTSLSKTEPRCSAGAHQSANCCLDGQLSLAGSWEPSPASSDEHGIGACPLPKAVRPYPPQASSVSMSQSNSAASYAPVKNMARYLFANANKFCLFTRNQAVCQECKATSMLIGRHARMHADVTRFCGFLPTPSTIRMPQVSRMSPGGGALQQQPNISMLTPFGTAAALQPQRKLSDMYLTGSGQQQNADGTHVGQTDCGKCFSALHMHRAADTSGLQALCVL